MLYSRLCLNGHLYKTDTSESLSLSEFVPAFLYSLYLTLHKTDIALRHIYSASPKGVLLRSCYTGRFATTNLAQHSLAMVGQCCNHSKQCRNNVAALCCAKNCRCNPLQRVDCNCLEQFSQLSRVPLTSILHVRYHLISNTRLRKNFLSRPKNYLQIPVPWWRLWSCPSATDLVPY